MTDFTIKLTGTEKDDYIKDRFPEPEPTPEPTSGTARDIINAFEQTNHLGGLDTVYIIGDSDNWDEFIENATQAIYETEVIYYHVAMAYLSENDPSLGESLALASEQGVEVDSLSSGILATLHLQQEMLSELYEIEEFEDSIFED